MKNFTFRLTIAGIFLIMLFQPSKVFEGASSGLLLWFQIVLPTLLPFIFISGILVKSNAVSLLTNLTGPLLSRFFKVSKTGTYPVATGFLCGYPMGAKAVSDLAFNGLIANKEARYLLSFCNNTSPAFIMNFLVLQNLKKEALMLPSLFILLIAPASQRSPRLALPIWFWLYFRFVQKNYSQAPSSGNTYYIRLWK